MVDIKILRALIRECVIAEAGRLRVIDYEKKDEEYRDAQEDRNKPQRGLASLSPTQEFGRRSDLATKELEEQIELAMADDENQSVEAYVEWAMDNDVETFNVVNLQAIARNVSGQPAPGATVINQIKQELFSYGLKRTEREKVDRSRRGFNDPVHGRSPYADSPGGGSGQGTRMGIGSMGFGMGGGQGSLGGGGSWSSSDSKNLPMGSRRR